MHDEEMLKTSSILQRQIDEKAEKIQKYKVILPFVFAMAVLIGIGGYLSYRNITTQNLQEQEETQAAKRND